MRFNPQLNQFVPYLGGISAEFVDYSSDHKSLCYVAYPEGTLWKANIDGSNRIQLTSPPLQVLEPRWSPDAKQIAFFAFPAGRPAQVYLIPSIGGEARAVTDGRHNAIQPNWSPDGRSIVFSYLPPFLKESDRVGILHLNLHTGRIEIFPGSSGLFAARWSPDGKFIAASDPSINSVRIFDVAAKRWTELVKGADFTFWSRDSKYVYYERPAPEPALMRIRVQDRATQYVASLKDVRATGALSEMEFSLAPDDSPLLLNDTGFQEIYSLALAEH